MAEESSEKTNEKKPVEHKTVHSTNKMKKSTMWQVISGILFIMLLASLIYSPGNRPGGKVMAADVAGKKAVEYINTNLLQPGTTATVTGVEDINGLYNVKLSISGREFDSYVTKDGSLLFPSAVDMNEAAATPEEETPPPAQGLVKADKPVVDLFVMSHCPFGTQAEKGMIPVAELLGDKIDFNIKFVNYAMHGEKEVFEEWNQYCIQKEEPSKYLSYLKCFLKAGDGAGCITQTKIDQAKLDSCKTAADEEFKITQNLNDQASWSGGRYPQFLTSAEENTKYGVRGSPTLVINGAQVSSARSPAAFLASICGAFNEAPSECQQKLSTANPSSGFGFEDTGTATTASCG